MVRLFRCSAKTSLGAPNIQHVIRVQQQDHGLEAVAQDLFLGFVIYPLFFSVYARVGYGFEGGEGKLSLSPCATISDSASEITDSTSKNEFLLFFR